MTDRRLFRQLVESPEILVLPGVFNGYSVRLVERCRLQGGGDHRRRHFGERARLGRSRHPDVRRKSARLPGARRMLAAFRCWPMPTPATATRSTSISSRAPSRRRGLRRSRSRIRSGRSAAATWRGKRVIPAREMADKVKAAVRCAARPRFHDPRAHRCGRDRRHSRGDRPAQSVCRGRRGHRVCRCAAVGRGHRARWRKNVSKPLAVNMGFGLIERGTTPLLTPKHCRTWRRHRLLCPHADERGAARHDERARGLRADDQCRQADLPPRPDGAVQANSTNSWD